MSEAVERALLETEVGVLVDRLHMLGQSVKDTSPQQDGTLNHYSLPDLRWLKNELRDLMRTLGGSKG